MFDSWKVPYNLPAAPFPAQKAEKFLELVPAGWRAAKRRVSKNVGLAASRVKGARMFSIIKKLIPSAAGNARGTRVSSGPVAARVDSSDPKGPQSSRTRSSAPGTLLHRNLCVVILRDTLRMYGIPREWIGIDVRNRSGLATMVQLQISFVIRHWHEDLLKYAPALQKQFLQSLQSFDPDTDYSTQVVFWRFSAKCNCPYTQIPGPSHWETPKLSDDRLQGAKATPKSDMPTLNLETAREQDAALPPAAPQRD